MVLVMNVVLHPRYPFVQGSALHSAVYEVNTAPLESEHKINDRLCPLPHPVRT